MPRELDIQIDGSADIRVHFPTCTGGRCFLHDWIVQRTHDLFIHGGMFSRYSNEVEAGTTVSIDIEFTPQQVAMLHAIGNWYAPPKLKLKP